MMAAMAKGSLIERLPAVRGELTAHAPLRRYSWFRTGGPAEVLFEPADDADLCAFLADIPKDVPLTVIGVGSNLLIRDGGVDGVVIRLGKPLANISFDGDIVTAGAGASDFAVANKARDKSIAGLEFLRGIPGSVGGAVFMNAGAYGRAMNDIVLDARVSDRQGHVSIWTAKDLGFSYRSSALESDHFVLSARLQGKPGDKAEIAARMKVISTERELSQPLRSRTGGSTFKNPQGMKAWELIDRAGCRGLRVGDAEVSEKHTNFLINRGKATAFDLETLGEEVRYRVMDHCGVELQWEIRRIGRFKGGEA